MDTREVRSAVAIQTRPPHAAKARTEALDCFVAFAPRNDGGHARAVVARRGAPPLQTWTDAAWLGLLQRAFGDQEGDGGDDGAGGDGDGVPTEMAHRVGDGEDEDAAVGRAETAAEVHGYGAGDGGRGPSTKSPSAGPWRRTGLPLPFHPKPLTPIGPIRQAQVTLVTNVLARTQLRQLPQQFRTP